MPTTADILIDTLIAWKVEVDFGLPGDGINGILEALRTRQEKIAFIQVRHEESAAFMATAYAKWTGKLGVCLAASGPPKMPADYAANFRQALPETPGREKIQASIADEPAKTMMETSS